MKHILYAGLVLFKEKAKHLSSLVFELLAALAFTNDVLNVYKKYD
jgi:hypothetical protein